MPGLLLRQIEAPLQILRVDYHQAVEPNLRCAELAGWVGRMLALVGLDPRVHEGAVDHAFLLALSVQALSAFREISCCQCSSTSRDVSAKLSSRDSRTRANRTAEPSKENRFAFFLGGFRSQFLQPRIDGIHALNIKLIYSQSILNFDWGGGRRPCLYAKSQRSYDRSTHHSLKMNAPYRSRARLSFRRRQVRGSDCHPQPTIQSKSSIESAVAFARVRSRASGVLFQLWRVFSANSANCSAAKRIPAFVHSS